MIVTLNNQDSGHLVVVVIVVHTKRTNIGMMKINDLAHKGRPLKMMNPMKVPQQRRQTKCIVCPPVSIVYIIVTC